MFSHTGQRGHGRVRLGGLPCMSELVLDMDKTIFYYLLNLDILHGILNTVIRFGHQSRQLLFHGAHFCFDLQDITFYPEKVIQFI